MAMQFKLTDEFVKEVWEQESIYKIINKAMLREDAATFKFTGDMVHDSQLLWEWAEYLVDHYVGEYALMVKFRMLQRTGNQLSKNQLAVVLNSLLSTWKRGLKNSMQESQIADAAVDFTTIKTFNNEIVPNPEGGRPSIEPQDTIEGLKATKTEVTSWMGFKVPQTGTYTFVDGAGEYRVLKFEEYQGTVFISYQNGNDNENSFAKFGKILEGGKLHIWASAFGKHDSKLKISNEQRASLRDAVEFICNMDKNAHLTFGEAYALRSGRCFICGRTLTVPSSISAGIGPICAEKWGV